MGFKVGIWASRLEFEPQGWGDLGLKAGDLGLKARILALRLGEEMDRWTEEEEEKEKFLHM